MTIRATYTHYPSMVVRYCDTDEPVTEPSMSDPGDLKEYDVPPEPPSGIRPADGVSLDLDKLGTCIAAIKRATDGYDSMTRLVALEMAHALSVVNDTTYDPEKDKPLALKSFAMELDGFADSKARRQARQAS